jgi:DnaJ-class molecular chaperone
MKKVISDLFNPETISKIIVDEQIKGFLLRGEYKYLKDYVYQKIQSHYMNKNTPNDYSDIFIPSRVNTGDSQTRYHVLENDTTYESSCVSTTNTSERDLHMTICTTLEEVYLDKKKEISVLRHKYIDQHTTVLEEQIFHIPLRDDKLVLRGEGDEFMVAKGIQRSDIHIKIKCRKHHFIQRVNDYDLLLFLPVTLNELFNGFSKSFDYFDNKTIGLNSKTPLKDHYFDGDKLVVVKPQLGLCSGNGRGSLIIYLLLNKNKKFYETLKLFSA